MIWAILVDDIYALADDPCAITRVPGRKEINYLNNWINKENLQLLNLL